MTAPPLQKSYDLSSLSQGGGEVVLTADEGTRAKLAAFAGVEEIRSFTARIDLKRPAPDRFLLGYTLDADIVQACVVTLEPVESRIALAFERELRLVHIRHRKVAVPESVEPAEGQDEGPEDIDNPVYDLAGPILEEFVLAIDPYPRAPGVEFSPPAEADAAADSPFSVLKKLKKQGS